MKKRRDTGGQRLRERERVREKERDRPTVYRERQRGRERGPKWRLQILISQVINSFISKNQRLFKIV